MSFNGKYFIIQRYQMIVTNNSIYLNTPRTGGTWIETVLAPITVAAANGEFPSQDLVQTHKNVFVFVRNPWSWYASVYNSNIAGTGQSMQHLFTALGYTPTFDDFVRAMENPGPMYKRKLLALCNADGASDTSCEMTFIHDWMVGSKSLYQTVCDRYYTIATRLGRIENIIVELKNMTIVAEEQNAVVDTNIDCTVKTNIGTPVNYHDMYTPELVDIVANSSKDLISRLNYRF